MNNLRPEIKATIKALEERKIAAYFAGNKKEAQKHLLKEIPSGSTVGIGGSMTIFELGLDTLLKENGCTVYWHWNEDNAPDQAAARRKAAGADFYLCSANALTLDGKLINIDGTGNRVASMVYGPRKAIIVVGINKLAENLDAALKRVKNTACPLNARRLKKNTPCAEKDRCLDCRSEDRMCNVTTIIEGKPGGIAMEVLIVAEELGF